MNHLTTLRGVPLPFFFPGSIESVSVVLGLMGDTVGTITVVVPYSYGIMVVIGVKVIGLTRVIGVLATGILVSLESDKGFIRFNVHNPDDEAFVNVLEVLEIAFCDFVGLPGNCITSIP